MKEQEKKGHIPITLDKIEKHLDNIEKTLNDIQQDIYEIRMTNIERDYKGRCYATVYRR